MTFTTEGSQRRRLMEFVIDRLRPLSFKGKARLLAPLCPQTGRRLADVFGYAMELDMAEYFQRYVYLGAYERRESKIVAGHLRNGMVFFDVGANIGYYSLMAAAKCGPEARIVAFEPNPEVAGHLARTVSTNRIRTITIEPFALSSAHDRQAKLYLGPADFATSTMVPGNGGIAVSVETTTLDAYLESHGIERVDFMKVDVDGFESEVFAGARKSLANGKIRALLYESSGSSPRAVYETLQSLGMRSDHQWTDSELAWANVLMHFRSSR